MAECSMIRVCVVAPGFMLGGQAVEARALVDKFAGDADVEIVLQPIDPRIPEIIARVRGLRTIVRWPIFALGLIRRLQKSDILHVFTAAFGPFVLTTMPAVLLGRLAGCRVIMNYRDGRAAQHLRRAWVRWLIRRAHVLVFPSGFLQHVFRQYGLDGQVVPNVVDTEVFRFRPRDRVQPRVISCRLLETLYAVDNTIAAFAAVQQAIPEASLVIAGDGHMRAELEQLVARLRLHNVQFTGRVDQATLTKLFDEADIFVNSSRIDNMPHAIVEAFSAGLPVITTPAGGIPWIVEHGNNGLMVPVDDPPAMAAAVLRIVADPNLAQTLIENGRRACETSYTWAVAGREWKRLYGQILGRGLAAGQAHPAQLRSTEVGE